ncbi:uncharacterized protein VP01_1874g7 [Puccinia sorghi]|uniref:Uncharacterized protein n=1 Tax=Puccinia sorghi TaxID=27349 RepID=A0A0L6VF29_9BASI|nr:uncharacterized protein VP01_1874g7 [Puccinia sorghi]
MPIPHHPIQLAGIQNYGRLKFNVELFKGEGPYELERKSIVELLNSIPKPYQGNFLLTQDQLALACESMRKRLSEFMAPTSMIQISIFMSNINNWYQYWNTHAKIDVETFNNEEKLSIWCFVFPLYLLYVEMIMSIIPSKKNQPLEKELDYPQEMRKAVHSYQEFKRIMKASPGNLEPRILREKRNSFYFASCIATHRPSSILWHFLEFWLECNYITVWNHIKELNGLHATKRFKSFFNTIFAHGVNTLNQKIAPHLPPQ